MRQRFVLLVVLLVVCLFSAKAQNVIEKESSILFNENSADVFLAVENSQEASENKIEIELLDAQNGVLARDVKTVRLFSGKKLYQLNLPLGETLRKNTESLIWFRLRYRVGNARGVVSVSEIVRDVFELRIIAAENILTGMTYRSRVRALQPFTQKAVADVRVEAELELELRSGDDEKLKLKAEGLTDADGFATLDFPIPLNAVYDTDGEIRVKAYKNGLIREAVEDINIGADDLNFLMLADKPIYQPEQMLNVRGILLKGQEGKTVLPDTEVEFRIEDEDNTVLYREKTKTSVFGIAAVSWKIPENAKLGDYRVRVKTVDQSEDTFIGFHRVKITRYDLPNFVVTAKALKPYYLPDEKEAEIEVRADYLFGKPVTNGKVRVVRENERKWNWKEQKYDIDEGEAHEGKADERGKFTAKFKLGEDFEDFEDSSRKFIDLGFTAYFTDLTTNRTEQRRFDVRLSREPIHVYFIGQNSERHPALPVTGYVSAFYADGSPAVCEVELKGREDDSDKKFKTLQKTKTNSFGAGKFEFMRPKFEDEDENLEIQIIAKDKNGLKGTFGIGEDLEEEISFDTDDDALQIETDKTVFKAGEAVKINLRSTLKSGLVYVDVVRGWSVVESRFVNLKDGRAELKIPYQNKFRGELKIAAFLEKDDADELIRTSRGIIFPAPENLQLTAEFDKESYKPGENALVNFNVRDADGRETESALGVVVFDQAVEERARTDSEFGGTFSNFRGWLGYGEAFGGINVKDLNELDPAKPVSDEMQLVAEVILHDSYYYPRIFHSRSYDTDAKSVYAETFTKQFESFEKIFKKHYETRNFEHPSDETGFQKILRENNFDFDALRDPWEQKYRVHFEVQKSYNILRISTSGADKTFGTKDDFTVSSLGFEYFRPLGQKIDKAVKDYHQRTGGFIRDQKTLLDELNLSELRDRFGNSYRFKFDVDGRFYRLSVRSFGPDGVDCDCTWKDDFDIWTNRIDYFAEPEARILKILETAKTFPLTETEFKQLLKTNGIDFDALRDGYGRPLYLVTNRFSRFWDKTTVEKVQKFGEEKAVERTVITPVTQEVITFTIRGRGLDGYQGNWDDANFAQFLRVLSEQTKDDKTPKPVVNQPVSYTPNTGSINGTVTDANDAAIPNATVTATNNDTQVARTATTNNDGNFTIANLSAGKYTVRVSASGFKASTRSDVPVTANNVTKVDFAVDAGAGVTAVEVTSDTTNSSIASLPVMAQSQTGFAMLLKTAPNVKPEPRAGGFQVDGASGAENIFIIDGKEVTNFRKGTLGDNQTDEETGDTKSPKSTPRLREYFPETLFWSPEVVTDKDGRAKLDFKMADNITTWKLYTIASTKDGRLGTAEKKVSVFQPFFVDLDPPRFLTDGDEIYLPTQVRNYTAQKQKVSVTMDKADWFAFLAPERQNIEVDKNASANAVFGFRALAPVKNGKQKVTALAEKESDAIEKVVTVRPNGEEIVRTETKLFTGNSTFDLAFPPNALPKTPKAELKIYPNLMAHVSEAVEGLLQRPYGCGEQTVSSTYPNLMILKFKSGKPDRQPTFLEQKARKYLKKGYERLLGYQMPDGGFSYWGGKSESDLALTAYALRFLTDAQAFVEVDKTVIEKARDFLVKQQRADGSWAKMYSWETTEDLRRTKMLTTYTARTLAQTKADKTALDKALAYLKTRNAEIDEPYALALYGLASLDAGNTEAVRETVQRLEKMAISEGDKVYWKLETNTPFYGWGTAGRLETTALVLQLLIKFQNLDGQPTTNNELINRATLFLLRAKDRYGVWYSTQTTINVLDAFLASLTTNQSGTLTVLLNGEKLRELNVSDEQIEPFILDISGQIVSADTLEIKSSTDARVMAQIVKTHYIDWKDSQSTTRNVNQSRAIRLDYKCDKLTAKPLETVTCAVEAERLGFQGYGMLLAEIGLPPGAEVSRESLEKAFGADWSLSRYDVLPDRLIVYMWARAGGSKFNFTFKPRYGINAQTPASVLYDYYNEEAKAVIEPLRFTVK